MMQQVSARQDAINARRIATFPFPVNAAHRQFLVTAGTPEERDAYVRKENRVLLISVLIVAAVSVVAGMMPKSPLPLPVAPRIESAGTVLAVELHETTFSTTSSVRTERGVYQVAGAVSWTHGDKATVKDDQDGARKGVKRLCVASEIKSDCYLLR